MNTQTLTEYLVCYHTPYDEVQEVFASLDGAIERAKNLDMPARVEKHTTKYTKEVIYF